MTLAVKIGDMPNTMKMASKQQPQEPADMSELGLRLGPADDGAGVKILEVKPDSVAEKQGLKAGDVILEVAGREVAGPSDVNAAIKENTKARVLMLVRTGDGQRFLALPLNKG